MPYLTRSVFAEIREDGAYVLTAPLVYDDVVAEAGFITDLATVPRIMRAIVDVAGRHNRPAITHDRGCVELLIAHREGRAPAWTPVQVDDRFRRGLAETGMRRGRRTLYWLGVRWGAAFSPYRRAGWWSTAHVVLPLSLLLLPLLLPLAVVSAGTTLVLRIGGWLLGAGLPSSGRRMAARPLPPPTRVALERGEIPADLFPDDLSWLPTRDPITGRLE